MNTYTTKHDTTEKTMTHEIGHGFEIVADFKNKIVVTKRNETIIERTRMEDLTIEDYERYIANVCEAAASLSEKGL